MAETGTVINGRPDQKNVVYDVKLVAEGRKDGACDQDTGQNNSNNLCLSNKNRKTEKKKKKKKNL